MSLYLPCRYCKRENQIDVIWLSIYSEEYVKKTTLDFYAACNNCEIDAFVEWPTNIDISPKIRESITTLQTKSLSNRILIYSYTAPNEGAVIHTYWRGLNLIGAFYEDEDITIDEIKLRCAEIQTQPFRQVY